MGCEERIARPIGGDVPGPHQNHPLDIGQYISQMVDRQPEAHALGYGSSRAVSTKSKLSILSAFRSGPLAAIWSQFGSANWMAFPSNEKTDKLTTEHRKLFWVNPCLPYANRCTNVHFTRRLVYRVIRSTIASYIALL